MLQNTIIFIILICIPLLGFPGAIGQRFFYKIAIYVIYHIGVFPRRPVWCLLDSSPDDPSQSIIISYLARFIFMILFNGIQSASGLSYPGVCVVYDISIVAVLLNDISDSVTDICRGPFITDNLIRLFIIIKIFVFCPPT